jgi:hypothetical protein
MDFIKKKGIWVLIIIPIIFHILQISRFAINYPISDEFRDILEPFVYFDKADTLKTKIFYLFLPENESIPAFLRAVTITFEKLTGQINFIHLLAFGNLFVFLLFGVYYKVYSAGKNFYLIAVASICIFNACLYESTSRSDITIYQISSISLSFLVFYLLTFTEERLSTGKKVVLLVALTILPFTNGNGFFTIVLSMLYLAFYRKDNFWRILVPLFLLQVAIYVIFASPSHRQGTIGLIMTYNYKLIIATFILCGGIFQIFSGDTGLVMTFIAGLFLTIFPTVVLLKSIKTSKYRFETLIFIFIMLSVFAILVKRYNYFLAGYFSVLSPHYKIFSMMLFILNVQLFFNFVKSNLLKIAVLILSVSLNLIWFIKTKPALQEQAKNQITELINIENKMINSSITGFYMPSQANYEYLKSREIFHPKELIGRIRHEINNNVKQTTADFELTEVAYEDFEEREWAYNKEKIYKISVKGKFDRNYSYYFQIIDKDQKYILTEAKPEAISFIDRVKNKFPYSSSLNEDVYLGVYNIGKPVQVKIIECKDFY